jgi:hypothetical protein
MVGKGNCKVLKVFPISKKWAGNTLNDEVPQKKEYSVGNRTEGKRRILRCNSKSST